MAEEGFVIGDRTYPFPTSFRLCDPVLVSQLTNMSWHQFVEMLEDAKDGSQDPASMAGMIGVAVWQGNPRWTRDRVVRFVEQLDMDSVEVVAPDEVDAVPPPEAASPSPPSPDQSTAEPASTSEPTATPGSTGQPPSDTSFPPSLQVA